MDPTRARLVDIGDDSTGARLVDKRRGFYWCKVSGQEAQILLVQG